MNQENNCPALQDKDRRRSRFDPLSASSVSLARALRSQADPRTPLKHPRALTGSLSLDPPGPSRTPTRPLLARRVSPLLALPAPRCVSGTQAPGNKGCPLVRFREA